MHIENMYHKESEVTHSVATTTRVVVERGGGAWQQLFEMRVRYSSRNVTTISIH